MPRVNLDRLPLLDTIDEGFTMADHAYVPDVLGT